MKQIDFKGIARSASVQNNADGNCEEIVNMRLHAGAWRATGKKKIIIDSADYERVYVHKYGMFENFIGVKNGTCVWFASQKEEKIEKQNQEICQVSGNAGFGQLNNILLVKDDDNIYKVVFTENSYSITILELPDTPDFDIRLSPQKKNPSGNDFIPFSIHTDKIDEMNAARELIRGLINKEKANYPDYSEGYVFLCTTYQLFDGSVTKPTPPMLIKLGEYVPGLIHSKDTPQTDTSDNHIVAEIRCGDMKLHQLEVRPYCPVTEEYKDMITKVNVYVTPIRSFYDMDAIFPERIAPENVAYRNIVVEEKELKENEVERMLFYKVFDEDVMNQTPKPHKIKFDSTLTTNETMPVDASGWINTTGDSFVYNNRVHLYNLRQRFVASKNIGISWLSWPPVGNRGRREMTAMVYLKVLNKNLVLKYDCSGMWPDEGAKVIVFPKVVAFPDSRAYRIVFYDRHYACTPFSVNLRPSATYNFAFGILRETSVPINWDTSVPARFPEVINQVDDNMNLIVSEAMNPYYFPPEHSYLMPGEIINLAVNTEQISTSQVGQFPLYVFTTEGIYALQVGDGRVLYSNVIPVSAEVAVKGSDVLQTKYGVVFATEKGLKVIAGNEVVDFSEPVNGALDLNIRAAKTYAGATDNPGMGVEVAKYLSRTSFREYVREAVMGYDISEDEVIISNPEYDYSYVFSLKTKTWHKITEVFSDLNRYVGLKEYMAGAVAARAMLRVECTVRPGRVVTFTKSATLRDREFSDGSVSITLEIQGVALFPFTYPIDTPVSLYDVIRAMNVPEEFLKVLEDEGKVFSNIYTGLWVANETVEIGEHFVFVQDVRAIPVGGVGEGEEFSVMLGSRKLTHTTVGSDSTRSVTKMIAAWAVEGGFTAAVDSLGVTIGAKPGAEGNRTLFSFVSSEHVELSSEGFSGGADVHRSREVCDIREEEACVQPVYLQTRPMRLDFYGFKKVSHYVLRGELRPAAERGFYGVFMFASNDLVHWECVADGGIKAGAPHVLLPRICHSFRYFVVMTGGYVRPGHVVAHAEIEGEARFDNRLR